jgi:hypothetical protein
LDPTLLILRDDLLKELSGQVFFRKPLAIRDETLRCNRSSCPTLARRMTGEALTTQRETTVDLLRELFHVHRIKDDLGPSGRFKETTVGVTDRGSLGDPGTDPELREGLRRESADGAAPAAEATTRGATRLGGLVADAPGW